MTGGHARTWSMLRRALIAGGGVALVAAIALAVIVSRGGHAAGPKLLAITNPLGPTGCFQGVDGAKEVRIDAPEAQLQGVVLGRGDVGVVLAPQLDETLCEWRLYAPFLAEKGYRVLALSFSELDRDPEDVVAAAKTLRRLGARRIVLFGASRGGTAVLDAAARIPVAGVVALSPPRFWGSSNADAAVGRSAAPLVIAVGRYDTEWAAGAIALARNAKARWKRLVVEQTGNHGVAMLTMARSPVDDAIAALFAHVGR